MKAGFAISVRCPKAVLSLAMLVAGGAADAAPNHLFAVLSHDAQAVAAVDVAGVTALDPHEKPSRLQEYVVVGTVTSCFKGALRPRSAVRFGLFSEGRPAMPSRIIAFLRQAKNHDQIWSAVDGPIVDDTPVHRRSVIAATSGCPS